MSHRLIVEGMKGSLSVINSTYTYKDIEYIGAEFTITLPM